MADPGIVRNRAKIEGAVRSARAYLAIHERQGFSAFLWDFVDGRPLQPRHATRADVPTETDVSRRLSKALRAEGFTFVGPTIVYAFMQAVGMTNDHLTGCWRHGTVAALPSPGWERVRG
jgi:DNA-3-methyladenine glycosylase I